MVQNIFSKNIIIGHNTKLINYFNSIDADWILNINDFFPPRP